MSFSFTAAGTPKELIAEVGKQTGPTGAPRGFIDAVNDQLSRLPEDAEVTVSLSGHTERVAGQISGGITLHAQLDWRVDSAEAAGTIEDKDPEVISRGPERFPEGFEADAPPGPSASDATA